MKRSMWLAIAAFVVIAVGVTLVAVPTPSEWTTSSPEAIAEFEEGYADLKKVYYEEALAHFNRALELDPDFLVAKLRVTQIMPDQNAEQTDQFKKELMDADLSALTPRERFLIEYWRAIQKNQDEEAARLLDRCVEEHPNDPFVVGAKAAVARDEGHLKEAERLYVRLLEIDPNWVVAYNALGYTKMIQTRFTEAEEHFKRYRFIAPDQANPHDSLGELFITTGRYGDAETSLEKALEIKPDFWASYQHLLVLKVYSGDFEAIPTIIERAKIAGMNEGALFDMQCTAHYSELADREAWQQILDERDNECVEGLKNRIAAIVTHRAACRLGDMDLAQSIEDQVAEIQASMEESGILSNGPVLRGTAYHLQGVRQAVQGELESAEFLFRAADEYFSFIEVDRGMFKLQNQLFLAETLLAGGKDADAHRLLADVRTVNPEVVRHFEDGGFRVLGLGRGQIPPDTAVAAIDPREGPNTSF